MLGLTQVYSNLSRPWGNKGGRLWDGQPFVHPSSFDTLVLDHALKNRVRPLLWHAGTAVHELVVDAA